MHHRPKKSNSKSLGTHIEKLLKAEVERSLGWHPTGNSAKGVDIPELDLGLKVTSNLKPQSSDPFVSAYQRILGATHEVLVLYYNSVAFDADDGTPLQIIDRKFLKKSELADASLCEIAKTLKRLAISKDGPDPVDLHRCLRVIAYANKSQSKTKYYRDLVDSLRSGDVKQLLDAIDEGEASILKDVLPPLPSDKEWDKFLKSPLDGKISISFADTPNLHSLRLQRWSRSLDRQNKSTSLWFQTGSRDRGDARSGQRRVVEGPVLQAGSPSFARAQAAGPPWR